MSNLAFHKMKIQFISPENGETETDPVVGGGISTLMLFLEGGIFDNFFLCMLCSKISAQVPAK